MSDEAPASYNAGPHVATRDPFVRAWPGSGTRVIVWVLTHGIPMGAGSICGRRCMKDELAGMGVQHGVLTGIQHDTVAVTKHVVDRATHSALPRREHNFRSVHSTADSVHCVCGHRSVGRGGGRSSPIVSVTVCYRLLLPRVP